MRCKISCVLLGLALDWTAIGHAALPPPSNDPPVPYTENRWIGRMENGLLKCPAVDGWRATSLLSVVAGNPTDTVDIGYLEPYLAKSGLDRFCIYTPGSGPQTRFPKRQLPAGLVDAKPDRLAVAPMSADDACSPDGALGQGLRIALEKDFLRQVGRVKLAPTDKPRVRLVFVDTQATGEGPPVEPSQSCHGYSMAHLARRLICGGGEPCAIQLATRLALCYDHYDGPDMALQKPGECHKGGRIGLVDDLAMAITAEVNKWVLSGRRQKLVLNLSVGWDGELHDPKISDQKVWESAQQEPGARAVYDALRYAADSGALVIAAAGNRRGGQPATRWPILPAVWELDHPSWWSRFDSQLIYAVGGVDWQGLPLPNARAGGLPWRVAYGDHAIARVEAPGSISGESTEKSTSVYTGSSVSTVVVSSTAAALWSLQPSLAPANVMRILREAAERQPGRADFFSGKTAPYLRRISLCRSVLAACGPSGSRCSALESIDCEFQHPSPSNIDVRGLPQTTIATGPESTAPGCASGTRVFRSPSLTATPGDLCPMEVLQDLRTPGRTGPQPGDNPCPTCTLVPEPPRTTSLATVLPAEQGYALLAEIDSRWQAAAPGMSIASAVLTIDCHEAGSGPRIFDLSGPFKSPSSFGSRRLLLGPIPGRSSLVGCSASVDFKVKATPIDPGRSVQSPVYVDP
jgi:hypothetical protein